MTEEPFNAKHLKFVIAPPKPRTKVWWVVQRQSDFQLGWIGWWGTWRRYSFFPKPDTVYEVDCLRDLANFCEQQTKAHREMRKAEREHRDT